MVVGSHSCRPHHVVSICSVFYPVFHFAAEDVDQGKFPYEFHNVIATTGEAGRVGWESSYWGLLVFIRLHALCYIGEVLPSCRD